MALFSKVLVANRGEIAVRIMRTLRTMGIATVAVYTDTDADSMHVALADESVCVGADAPSRYLDINAIISAARATGAQAIHPGYGFLSERAEFCEACGAAGLVFIGPEADHLRRFGEKHSARELAESANVPLLAGTGLLIDADAAIAAATQIGYPVMLKASAGGGGIGMRRCDTPTELHEAFAVVDGLAQRNFGGGGVFLERFVTTARHVEVQVFGNGVDVISLGDRDCSAQRRNQKVIEEAPAPGLDAQLRVELHDAAVRLMKSIGYRSAGTVEFVVDAERNEFAFLEVNTRLQVEHGVTEAVLDIDLVEWMIRESSGVLGPLRELESELAQNGAAIEVRIYAEDPCKEFQPSTGVLTAVTLPSDSRVDTWVEAGTEVSPYYDPMLAKIIVTGLSREQALDHLNRVLSETRIDGVCTNIGYLRDAVQDRSFVAGAYNTTLLDGIHHAPRRIDVLEGGMQTTVQDTPGRVGYWAVGIPPSGPMDDLALRRANQIVGNPNGSAGLECTRVGPSLQFVADSVIALCGAPTAAEIDGAPVPADTAIAVNAGSVLRVGAVSGVGARVYLAVAGGLDVPRYLHAHATFVLGGFGGHAGRALRAGDVVPVGDDSLCDRVVEPAPEPFCNQWVIGVFDGPHGAPDFFTERDISMLYETLWEVHHHSDRTGVRLIGPSPEWARVDGGEAGLHPSNIHDNAYAIGTIDFTGDMPVILGPDGPSLGGFVCPITIVARERWKVGQLSPGDTVQFEHAHAHERGGAVVRRVAHRNARPDLTVRRAGDEYGLVEFGPNLLDLELRARVHALQLALESHAVAGIEEMVPGVRSLLLRVDASRSLDDVLSDVVAVEARLPDVSDLEVPSRVVHLPLSWADPSTQVAVDRYMQVVRDDAPWCPDNLEFIRRINGLDTVDDVRKIVFDATYLVLGLGDVYLGAPLATPIDPRHRLVTTKYNPARTWTPQNAVGIGGAYMCVYGMEGPGGYQLVGRTIQVWNTYRRTPEFPSTERWLLRWFDQIRFHQVTTDELSVLRRDFATGRHRIEIENSTLRLADHRELLREHSGSISIAQGRQRAAFEAERQRWVDHGESDRVRALLRASVDAPRIVADDEIPLASGLVGVTSPIHGLVVRVNAVGDAVKAGDAVAVVEAMKTETQIGAPCDARVVDVRCSAGEMVTPGRVLLGLEPT